jgi:integration host factor subunit beta
MVRSEICARLIEAYPHLTPRDAEIILATIFGEIAAALSRDDRVQLRGFGSFSVKYRDARMGRNPRSGVSVAIPRKRVPHFRTGGPMSARLNGGAKGGAGQRPRRSGASIYRALAKNPCA